MTLQRTRCHAIRRTNLSDRRALNALIWRAQVLWPGLPPSLARPKQRSTTRFSEVSLGSAGCAAGRSVLLRTFWEGSKIDCTPSSEVGLQARRCRQRPSTLPGHSQEGLTEGRCTSQAGDTAAAEGSDSTATHRASYEARVARAAEAAWAGARFSPGPVAIQVVEGKGFIGRALIFPTMLRPMPPPPPPSGRWGSTRCARLARGAALRATIARIARFGSPFASAPASG